MNIDKLQDDIEHQNQRLFSSRFKRQKSGWHLKYVKTPNAFLSLLCWTGLLEDSDKTSKRRLVSRILMVLLVLFTIDMIVSTLLRSIAELFMTSIFLSNYIMSALVWITMRQKRKQLSAFLRLLHEIQPQNMTWKINLTLYCICISSVVVAVLDALSSYRAEMVVHLAYGYTIDNLYAQILILFIKSLMYSTIYPMCPIIIALLLCLLCRKICNQIYSLTLLIETCSSEQFTVAFQLNILNQNRRIDDVLFILQKVFYLPSFLICATSFCSCCTLVAWIFRGFNNSLELAMMLPIILYFFMCAVSLLACLWIAGGLPVELEAFNEAFHKKLYLTQLVNTETKEIDFEKHSSQRPVFVLTGCDIIHFKRSAILTLAGAVLTYTLLIMKL